MEYAVLKGFCTKTRIVGRSRQEFETIAHEIEPNLHIHWKDGNLSIPLCFLENECRLCQSSSEAKEDCSVPKNTFKIRGAIVFENKEAIENVITREIPPAKEEESTSTLTCESPVACPAAALVMSERSGSGSDEGKHPTVVAGDFPEKTNEEPTKFLKTAVELPTESLKGTSSSPEDSSSGSVLTENRDVMHDNQQLENHEQPLQTDLSKVSLDATKTESVEESSPTTPLNQEEGGEGKEEEGQDDDLNYSFDEPIDTDFNVTQVPVGSEDEDEEKGGEGQTSATSVEAEAGSASGELAAIQCLILERLQVLAEEGVL